MKNLAGNTFRILVRIALGVTIFLAFNYAFGLVNGKTNATSTINDMIKKINDYDTPYTFTYHYEEYDEANPQVIVYEFYEVITFDGESTLTINFQDFEVDDNYSLDINSEEGQEVITNISNSIDYIKESFDNNIDNNAKKENDTVLVNGETTDNEIYNSILHNDGSNLKETLSSSTYKTVTEITFLQ